MSSWVNWLIIRLEQMSKCLSIRDQFVKVKKIPSDSDSWNILNASEVLNYGPYDYSSVMHYSPGNLIGMVRGKISDAFVNRLPNIAISLLFHFSRVNSLFSEMRLLWPERRNE